MRAQHVQHTTPHTKIKQCATKTRLKGSFFYSEYLLISKSLNLHYESLQRLESINNITIFHKRQGNTCM